MLQRLSNPPAIPGPPPGAGKLALSVMPVVAALALVLLFSQFSEKPLAPWYVGLSGLVMAALLYLSTRISPFLRVFIVMYALGYVFLAGGSALSVLDRLPQLAKDLMPPAFMAAAAVSFGLIAYLVSFIPVVRTVTGITDPYFYNNEPPTIPYGALGRPFGDHGRAAQAMLGFNVAINFILVGIDIRLNLWFRDLFDALQKNDEPAFWFQIWWVFVPLLVLWCIFVLIDFASDQVFNMRWREWMTKQFYSRWLSNGTQYRMQVLNLEADNPDQRIAEDVNSFIVRTMSLSARMMTQLANLVSFSVILWGISAGFTFPGTSIPVPGLLLWVALAYALIGTVVTHFIGRPLIRLDFLQEKAEASFRFRLARLREYGEQIALFSGAKNEIQGLTRSFKQVLENFWRLLSRKLKLTTFTFSWGQMSVAFPYSLMGAYFFTKKVTLGQLQQGAQAFRSVYSAMSFFITSYQTLAAYKAVLDRLTTFNDSMDKAEHAATGGRTINAHAHSSGDVTINNLALSLPDGRTIVRAAALALEAGKATLVTGPSGSGKSTLFRAIAGIWPFGAGDISVPDGKAVMLLPQRPYIPQGALSGAVTYPALAGSFTIEAITEALKAVKLGHLVPRLEEDLPWQQVLSGGEQQRLAIARALLAKPDWLFLDEATAALDEPLEREMYAVIKRGLPGTTVVSIGHRSTLIDLHDARIDMAMRDDGVFEPRVLQAA